MNGNRYIVDTNIVLYLLGGDETIAEILNQQKIYISFITELELLGYKNLNRAELKLIKNFLNDCIIIDINKEIKEHTIKLRKKTGIKLPDCIIAGTSLFLKLPLITSDKDFKKFPEISLIYYEIES